MLVRQTRLPEVQIIETRVFSDARGSFRETWSRDRYTEAGIAAEFVQDNVSVSNKGVLRGLHYQHPSGQGKLVSVLQGSVFDVAVDIRHGSPRFGSWVGVELSAENGLQLWIPEGFAHGFLTLDDDVVFAYRCTEFYRPDAEGSVLWSDPEIGIEWPLGNLEHPPIMAEKDAAAPPLAEIASERLPAYEEAVL